MHNLLPEKLDIVRCFCEEAEHDKTDAANDLARRQSGCEHYAHSSQHAFRQVVQPWQEEERREQDEGRGNK